MHVHDVDMINYLFGMPKAVTSRSTSNKAELESIFTTYDFDNILVSSAADWSFPQTFEFDSAMTVLFEKAAVVISGSNLTVYTDDEVIKPPIDETDYFYKELSEFIDCAVKGEESKISDCKSVMNSMKIAEAEILSAEADGKKIFI